MSTAIPLSTRMEGLPDHNDLPDKDDAIVDNFLEHPQSILLSTSLRPWLDRRHPDGQYAILQDSGIYWRIANPEEPLERGAISPDWCYIPNVPPMLDGEMRRSYVLWQEHQSPFLLIEYSSRGGEVERDHTERTGKLWIYENVLQARYYLIYDGWFQTLEGFRLVDGRYQPLSMNAAGRIAIPELDLEFGLRKDHYAGMDAFWLRAWDHEGNLLLSGEERAELYAGQIEKERTIAKREHQRAEKESRKASKEKDRADKEKDRAEKLAAQLRALGMEPDA